MIVVQALGTLLALAVVVGFVYSVGYAIFDCIDTIIDWLGLSDKIAKRKRPKRSHASDNDILQPFVHHSPSSIAQNQVDILRNSLEACERRIQEKKRAITFLKSRKDSMPPEKYADQMNLLEAHLRYETDRYDSIRSDFQKVLKDTQ